MTILMYDGSFEGLLTAIYECLNMETIITKKIIPKKQIQYNFFEKYEFVKTDFIKAKKLQEKIVNNISPIALHKIFYVYLSEIENKEELIFKFLKLGFDAQNHNDNYSNNIVLTINKITQSILKEKHLFLGLIRFRELENNIFYAPIEPQFNILILLIPHFLKRMASQNWIIHDTKRKIGAIYNQKNLLLIELEKIIPTFSEQEVKYQSLWKEYFENVKIEHRINLKLQKKYIPIRYWKNLIEKSPK